jgi:hypothetical protein
MWMSVGGGDDRDRKDSSIEGKNGSNVFKTAAMVEVT